MPRKKADTSAAAPVKEKTTKSKAVEEKLVEAKTRKTPCKTSICVEMGGLSVDVADIQNAVKKAVKQKGLDASEVKIYVNAAEQAAYYTIDGEGSEESKVDLNNL